LAVPKLKKTIFHPSSKEGNSAVQAFVETNLDSKSNLDLNSSDISSGDANAEYIQLQLRIFRMEIILTVFAVLICSIFFDRHSAISLCIGACSGILYMRLLARGIGKLGKSSMSVSKVQLLVPILLFFLISRFPEIQLWPALLGFLLYKPSLIIQFLLEP